MRFVLIDNGEPTFRRMDKLLAKYGPHIKMTANNINFDKIRPDDVLILSGGNHVEVAGHEDYYADEIKLVQNHPNTIIGICLGMQLIAHAYGSKIITRGRRIFKKKIFISPEPGCGILDKTVKVYENHRFAVRATPKGFDVLARSNSDIEIIKHKSKPIWGMQFHPECSGAIGEKVFKEILEP